MTVKAILSVDAVRYPLTGTGRYALELARHLPQVGTIDTLRYFGTAGFVAEPPSPRESASAAAGTLRRLLQKSGAVVALRQVVLNHRRKRALSGFEDHVYHGPNYYLPPREGPNVVTIHDLSIFTMPECHPPERVRYMREQIALSLKRATRLITDCAFTREETAAYFGWPIERIDVIPLASSGNFVPQDEIQVAPVLTRFGLSHRGYCLYAGTIEPRKNIGRLLEAYERLPQQLRQRFPLVLVGYRGWQSESVHARIAAGEREGWARYVGYVPGADLPALYAGARLFALPSLYEGFGLPVLEAMASATPVITSDRSSLPEVAGSAALTVDPYDVNGLREMLRIGLEDEAWQEKARADGLKQAARFSWRRCAEETARSYALAAGRASIT